MKHCTLNCTRDGKPMESCSVCAPATDKLAELEAREAFVKWYGERFKGRKVFPRMCEEAFNAGRTELKELVGRAATMEKLLRRYSANDHVHGGCDELTSETETLLEAIDAELEASIGKPAGKDFIPPSSGQHRD